MRARRWRARARAALITAVVAGVVFEGGHALAQTLDRAVAAWVTGVESASRTMSSWAPPPAPRPPPTAASVPRDRATAPRHRARLPRASAPLAPDEVLDSVRAAFCPEAARRLCDARRRCGCVYAEPDCVERVERACSDGVFAWDASVEPLELDPAVVDRCLEGFAELPTHCELAAAVVHGCGWPVREPVEVGDECVENDIRCRGGVCSGGVCEPTPAEGDRAAGHFCALDDVEVGGTCRLASGPGGTCDDYQQCAESRYDCTDHRCVPRGPIGTPCGSAWECDTGLACIDRAHEGLRRCSPSPTWCQPDTDCGSERDCALPPSTCRACTSGDDCVGTVRCLDGERCEAGTECVAPATTDGRCQPLLCHVGDLERIFREILR